MDTVRGAIEELDREENRLLALRNADATRSAAAAVAGLAVFTLGILVLAVLSFYFIPREIRGARSRPFAQQRSPSSAALQANAIESSVNGILIADAARPDHPLVYVNVASRRPPATPPRSSAANCRFLQAPTPTSPAWRKSASPPRRQGNGSRSSKLPQGRNLFWNQLKISPVRNEAGVTQIRRDPERHHRLSLRGELERNANYDSLTGLPTATSSPTGCSAPLSARALGKARGDPVDEL